MTRPNHQRRSDRADSRAQKRRAVHEAKNGQPRDFHSTALRKSFETLINRDFSHFQPAR